VRPPRALSLLLLVPFLGAFVSAQEPARLAPFAVTADRTTRPSDAPAADRRWWPGDRLADASTIDQALRLDPAFSLFRRTGSLAANPTAQGVSLRGVGPSGASRSLVLLDGVPLNDPFGGWVAWTQVAPTALAGAEVQHGGGSAAWGNAALGGTIALISTPLAQPANELRLEAGEFNTRTATLTAGATHAGLSVRIDARAFATDGFQPLEAVDRGAVDRSLASDHRLAQVQLEQAFDSFSARLVLRHFMEDRSNGTVLQRNSSATDAAALTLRGRTRAAEWQAVLYRQSQTFRSFFSAVAANRASETPANDQFDVPADAAGFGLTAASDREGYRLVGGLDYRQVRGETREDFLFANGTFTRRRHAGGTQRFGGVFLSAERTLRPDLDALVQVRADRWENRDGHRFEADRATGALTRNDRFADRVGDQYHGTVRLTWEPVPAWTVRGSAYSAFRVPTLNELYRPFRVGNTNTEANPALQPETLRGVEAGFEHRAGRATVALSGFLNELDDAVANVTLASTPTLVSRQRLNLARLRIRGVEGRVTADWSREWSVEAAFLRVDPRVLDAPVQPALAGRRLAQVPPLTLTAGATWRPTLAWRVAVQARWMDEQFEDDENTLPLGSGGTVDVLLEHQVSRALAFTLAAENLFDTRLASARTAGGPISYASPRLVRAGVRIGF